MGKKKKRKRKREGEKGRQRFFSYFYVKAWLEKKWQLLRFFFLILEQHRLIEQN